MSFRLTLDGAELDLFPDFTVEYSIEVYSALNPDEVKSPVSFSNRFPYTDNNKSVVNYDFDTDRSDYPLLGKAYLLSNNGTTISEGIAYLSLVNVNSDEPYFELRFEDKATLLINDIKNLEWEDVYDDAFSTQTNVLEDYLDNNQQYDRRDIELAYIDVCNDNEKYRYERRQFTSWGLTGKKTGLIPTLNVVNFIYRVFSAVNETVSSAFLSNVGTWKTENLYALVPSQLMRQRTGDRAQVLNPYPYNVFKNENLLNGLPSSYQVTVYYNPVQELFLEMPGTNYNNAISAGSQAGTYGAYYVSQENPLEIPDPQTEGVRLGYIAYSSGFRGRIRLATQGVAPTLKLAIPAVSVTGPTGQDWGLLVDRFKDLSNATFIPKAIIFRSGSPVAELPLTDNSGNIAELVPAFFEDGPAMDQEHNGFGHNHENVIVFEPKNLFLNYEIDIFASSQYSIAYKIDVNGYFQVDLVDDKDNVFATDYVVFPQAIAKARIFNYGYLALQAVIDTAKDYTAVTPDDEFTFQYSLQTSATISPYELFSEVVNRFGLSIIYDHNQTAFVLDTLNDMRSGSVGLPLDDYIDNLLPYEISGGEEKYGNFRLLNEVNDGLYDERVDKLAYGSFSGKVSTGGNGTYSIQFDGALINRDAKTVCGDVAPLPDQAIQKLLPSEEVGIISNEILDFSDIGLRFFYLRQHQYETTIRYPQYLDSNAYGQVVQSLSYKPLGPYFLGGYPINFNGDNLNLEFGDETSLDSFYTYYTNLDKVQAASRTKMKFNAAVPVSYITNLYFFNQYFLFENPVENFVIDSVQGRIYDNYFYGEFTVRFL